ncbi:MAG: succinate dehydrogenase cytochrome b subunit [Candidatus Brocadiae bacterium]|nr:succinate dehydrogenase cytochrome b subunit [Candidatus Brocadiia bacterium]
MASSCGCWVRDFLCSSIGRKTVMAATGLALFGFIVGHLAGNLQAFIPDHGATMKQYADMLHSKPALLWGARIGLLVLLLVHVVTAVSLAIANRAARPVPYQAKAWREASYASRTMMVSGPLILFYVVYHLLHFTTGHAHPDFQAGDPYRNLVIGFSNPLVAIVYIAAMAMLTAHLAHGLWSVAQTLGINHPKYTATLRRLSVLIALLIGAGYISVPVAVLARILK